MKEFLKVFLRGLIVTVTLPLWVALLVLYTVYLLIVYLISLIRNIIVFFSGGSIHETKEDIEVKQILYKNAQTEANMTETLTNIMHTAIAQNPEAIQAMAQQQIAMNRAQQASPQQIGSQQAASTDAPIDVVDSEVTNGGSNND